MTAIAAIEVQGVVLHVADQGPSEGPALVFANSLGTDFRIWDRVLPLLRPGLRLIRYDLRGHGLSGCPRVPWGMADHTADLAGLLDALSVRRAVVCGLSVGGMIAQALAAARPEQVRALILCDTAARIGTAELWNARIEAIEAGGIEALAEPILERWFSKAFRAGRQVELQLWRAMLVRTPVEGYLATCSAIRDTDLSASTAALRLPVLALAGDEDGATPPDLVRATAALVPGARFEIIPGAGHLPCVESPEPTARLINGFLQEIGHA